MKRFIGLTLALMMTVQLICMVPLYATEEQITSVETEEAMFLTGESETVAEDEDVSPEMFADFLKFDSYQVRETEYNGLRALFKVDFTMLPLMEEKGFSLVEYGTAIAVTSKLGENELTVSKTENGDYETLSCAKLFTISRNGEYIGKYISKNASELTYACTVINFNVNTYDKNVTFRGYTVIADDEGNEFVLYSDYQNEEHRAVNLKDMCMSMLNAGVITKDNISYKDVQEFAEEKGWSPPFRP